MNAGRLSILGLLTFSLLSTVAPSDAGASAVALQCYRWRGGLGAADSRPGRKPYGTTVIGGRLGNGVVFQLVPTGNGDWTENVLHEFVEAAMERIQLVGSRLTPQEIFTAPPNRAESLSAIATLRAAVRSSSSCPPAAPGGSPSFIASKAVLTVTTLSPA